jgi:N12 class adenine-specific DNA methylase
VQAEDRPATAAEQAVMARWAGWGAVPEVFDERPARPGEAGGEPLRVRLGWAREQLRELLSAEEYAAARVNTLNAHYTDAALVRAIWDGVGRLGFTGGQVLEPGCGSGNFIGFAPAGAHATGVELDPVTAGIARALYPDAEILAGSFADVRAARGSFDLTIGNVPFGNFPPPDPVYNQGRNSIHNYFILKSLHLTRPGGLVAVLTSRYTMDARPPGVRREMAALADLVGAVRLPSRAHAAAAGTSVVTDLLILRRREPGREPSGAEWEQSRPLDVDGTQIDVNEYFAEHPEMVLGEFALGGAYRADDLAVIAGRPAAETLPAALTALAARARAAGLVLTPPAGDAPQAGPAALVPDSDRLPDGYITARPDGAFTRTAGGQEVTYEPPAAQAPELRALCGIRDAVVGLLTAEAATLDDHGELDALRAELGRRYDACTARYGPLNRFSWRRTGRTGDDGQERMARIRPPQGGFRTDPFAPAVYALEDFNPVTQTAVKAEIFTRRVVAPRQPRLGADNPADALAICLDTWGEARLPEIARLLGASETDAREQLGSLVYEIPPAPAAAGAGLTDHVAADIAGLSGFPVSAADLTGERVSAVPAPAEPPPGTLVPAAEYLSGNVRDKLRTADAAARAEPRFEVNAAALREVIPADLAPEDIDARLGAVWVEPGYVRQFLAEILEDPGVKVEHPGGAMWAVRGDRHSVHATSTWGTGRMPAPAIAQTILEQRTIQVFDEDDNGSRVFNPEATVAAQEKATEMGDRFAEWAWEDPARAEELARVYNEKFNAIVLRSYDGAQLSLPGLAVTFTPRPHQLAAVARIIAEPAVLLAHEVGAGKTAEMVIGAMELRRLQMARKPAIVVPNHMIEQFSREFLQTYPQARLLIAQREDLQGDHRRQFIARCATGDWDAVIMSRSALERIPMSAGAQRAYMDRELEQMRAMLAKVNAGEGISVKRLEAAILRTEERLQRKLDAAMKDPGITFEQTGIDYVFYDEAQGAKNLRTPSNIPGAAIDGSQRASDLDMKIHYLRQQSGSSRVVTFATATPISNSVTEAYVMQRYLRPDLLAAAGIEDFDSWAATFGQTVTEIELAPEGGGSFRQKTRFARFRNVPEMLRLWHVSADIKTGEDLGLPVPALAPRPDGQRSPETVIAAPSDRGQEYVSELGDRAEAVRGRMVEPEEDNMLKISGDGRKAALDLRLVGLEPEPGAPPGKLAIAAERIAGIWAANRDHQYPGPDGTPDPARGSLQLVFCDLGTPGGKGWSAYDELRDQLAARGVPREMIRFIHDAKTDRDKGELFAACRTGSVAVLVGSTEKMGVGTNVQARAVALHHLDCPWRPSDVTQREGRIMRQGNLNDEVQILRYVTEGSFDGYMWQAVERKDRFIKQVMTGKLDVREIEEIRDSTLSYSEVKALATGNPLLMEKADADTRLARLERAARAHRRGHDDLRRRITSFEQRIPRLDAIAAGARTAIGRRRDTRGDAFTMTVDGQRHAKRATAGARLKDLAENAFRQQGGKGSWSSPERAVGELGGFPLLMAAGSILGSPEVSLSLEGAPGTEMRFTRAGFGNTDAAGLIIRAENKLAALEQTGAAAERDADGLRDEAARARTALETPFPHTDELAAARQRSAAIAEALADAEKPPAPASNGPPPPPPATPPAARPAAAQAAPPPAASPAAAEAAAEAGEYKPHQCPPGAPLLSWSPETRAALDAAATLEELATVWADLEDDALVDDMGGAEWRHAVSHLAWRLQHPGPAAGPAAGSKASLAAEGTEYHPHQCAPGKAMPQWRPDVQARIDGTASLQELIQVWAALEKQDQVTPAGSAEWRHAVSHLAWRLKNPGPAAARAAAMPSPAGSPQPAAGASRPDAAAAAPVAGEGGPGSPDPGIVIDHRGEGTLIRGTSRDDMDARRALADLGFRWSRRLGAWYLPRPWSYNHRSTRVDDLVRRLTGLGRSLTIAPGPAAASTASAAGIAARAFPASPGQRTAGPGPQHPGPPGRAYESAAPDSQVGW